MNRLRTGFPPDYFTCPIFFECSGCTLKEKVRTPPVLERLQKFFLEKGVTADCVSLEITGWRSKAKLPVRGSSLHPKIGLFGKGTHEVVNMPFCPHHSPLMDETVRLIRGKISLHKIKPYKEEESKGRLRYIQMLFNRKEKTLQLSLMFFGENLEKNEGDFIEDLYKSRSFWHSIWVNFVSDPTNTILGPRWEKIFGQEEFWQEISGIPFYFHPSSFSQAHLSVFEEMLQYLDSLIPEGLNILEFYAGVGCIGLFLAHKSSKVSLVESSPDSKSCFFKTLAKQPLEIREKCIFFQEAVEDFPLPEEKVDVLILDPPRKGLSKKCKEKIFSIAPAQIFYVSCGPDSFMRDCEDLIREGFKMKEARSFLLFPGTDHAEIIARFEGKKSGE